MDNIVKEIYEVLAEELDSSWYGESSVLEMKNKGGRNWRQMEWPGFYFEFKCDEIFTTKSIMEIPGPSYGRVEFDGFREIPWDFKAHSIQAGHNVPTNGYQEILLALEEYGKVGFIIANGDVVYDEDGSFIAWHDELKGKKSDYVKEREKRGAPRRRRKKEFHLRSIDFIIIDSESITYTSSFQKNMRNADGSPRNSKVMLDLREERFERYTFNF